MSQWTHVNGNIRYDYLPIADCEGFKKEVVKVFGKTINYENMGEIDSHIPCGREGSIEYYIYEVPRGYNIGIWGDLRDFGEGEVKDIFNWFEKIMKYKSKSPIFVREAVLYIDIEYGDKFVLIDDRHNDDNDKKYKTINIKGT